MYVVVGVDVGGLAARQLAEALQLRVELFGGVAGIVELRAVVDEVQPGRQLRMAFREFGRLRRGGRRDHQAGARQHAARVGLDDLRR